mmetsp:Transcript_8698/g.22512  ORF Transcript_8698/g.22512 Transcript_8698/m.22512 type:complete len:97 (+) Transcript_8698:500-790(+)
MLCIVGWTLEGQTERGANFTRLRYMQRLKAEECAETVVSERDYLDDLMEVLCECTTPLLDELTAQGVHKQVVARQSWQVAPRSMMLAKDVGEDFKF